MVALAPASLITGGVISRTVMVWVFVPLVLPPASVATLALHDALPISQVPSAVLSVPTCVTVALLHESDAVGAVNVGEAGQSVVALAVGSLITGGAILRTAMVWVFVPLVLPQASVAIQVRVSE